MMIDKRLIGMMGDSKRYIVRNVALQWLALAASIAMIFAVSRYLGALYDQLTIGDCMAGAPNLPLTLAVMAAALLVRAACTRGAADASYNASRTVKKRCAARFMKNYCAWAAATPRRRPLPRSCSWRARGSSSSRLISARTCRSFSMRCLRPSRCFSCWPPSA